MSTKVIGRDESSSGKETNAGPNAIQLKLWSRIVAQSFTLPHRRLAVGSVFPLSSVSGVAGVLQIENY